MLNDGGGRTTLARTLGREFVRVVVWANGDDSKENWRRVRIAAETALRRQSMSLDDLVRTRLWAASRESWSAANQLRYGALSGRRRAASSSYISSERFDGRHGIGLDLVALRDDLRHRKVVVEYDPEAVPPRYVANGGLLFLSGVVSEASGLAAQVQGTLGQIDGSLVHAGFDRSHVIGLKAFVSPSVDLTRDIQLLVDRTPDGASLTVDSVEGFSRPNSLVEVEVTANVGNRLSFKNLSGAELA